MQVLGIDIGTTSICAAVIDGETGNVVEAVNTKNDAFLETGAAYERAQDPVKILDRVTTITDTLTGKYAPIAAIGLTGQMHGIVYVDATGRAVSPLYTWQDGRGDLPCRDGGTYAQVLSHITGYKLATGYGVVTHYYNQSNGLVPEAAAAFCTIADYVGMALTGRHMPLTHSSDAASLGLFDLAKGAFDGAAIAAAGMESAMFPKVTEKCAVLGHTASGIPVASAVGDNQASFAGSVSGDDSGVLVNIGTGSQISVLSAEAFDPGCLEARPFSDGNYLHVGSSLCGGRAFALLEEFFRSVVHAAGYGCESMYPAMNKLAAGFESLPNGLTIEPLFCGTRENPDSRGSITNIGVDNFAPEYFVVGILWGIIEELYAKYSTENRPDRIRAIVASGNGVRKIPAMRKMLSKKFGAEVKIPLYTEEAAYGAALFAMAAAGLVPDFKTARRIIRYT